LARQLFRKAALMSQDTLEELFDLTENNINDIAAFTEFAYLEEDDVEELHYFGNWFLSEEDAETNWQLAFLSNNLHTYLSKSAIKSIFKQNKK
jgi:hypothetical protein